MKLLKKVIMLALCMVTHAACGMIDAVKTENIDAVKKLIKNDPKSVHEREYKGRTPLMDAAARNYDIAKLLLDNGAKVNEKDEDGKTPLIWAVIGRNENSFKLLLENGADVNARDNKGWSVLMWAHSRRNEKVIKLLGEYGAQLSEKDTADVMKHELSISEKDTADVIKHALLSGNFGVIKIWIDKAHKDNNKDLLRSISLQMLESLQVLKVPKNKF